MQVPGSRKGIDIVITPDRWDGRDAIAGIYQDKVHQETGGSAVSVYKGMDIH